MYLSEVKANQPPMDDFKQGRNIKIHTDTDDHLKWEKPNSKPLAPGIAPEINAYDTMGVKNLSVRHTRFSDFLVIKSKKNRQEDQQDVYSHEVHEADKPLYSSFNPNRVFPEQPGDKKHISKLSRNPPPIQDNDYQQLNSKKIQSYGVGFEDGQNKDGEQFRGCEVPLQPPRAQAEAEAFVCEDLQSPQAQAEAQAFVCEDLRDYFAQDIHAERTWKQVFPNGSFYNAPRSQVDLFFYAVSHLLANSDERA